MTLQEMIKSFADNRKPLLINSVNQSLIAAKRQIDEEAKYHNLTWKRDALISLKKEAIAMFNEAINEAYAVSREYDQKIAKAREQQYTGPKLGNVSIDAVELEFKSLKAELNMAQDKHSVIDRYLASPTGAKAVMLMFSEKDLDLGLWSYDIYERAVVKSKSKAELDFEANKELKVQKLQDELSSMFNIGNLLAAQRILSGHPGAGLNSLERQFDLDIAACDNEIRTEYEVLKNQMRRDIALETAREAKVPDIAAVE